MSEIYLFNKAYLSLKSIGDALSLIVESFVLGGLAPLLAQQSLASRYLLLQVADFLGELGLNSKRNVFVTSEYRTSEMVAQTHLV